MFSKKLRIYGFTIGRFLVGTALILATAYTLSQFYRVGSVPLTILSGLLFSVLVSSFSEWVFHAFLYHHQIPGMKKIFTVHQVAHHFVMFPPAKYVQTKSKYEHMNIYGKLQPYRLAQNEFENRLMAAAQLIMHMGVGIFFVFIPAWLLTHNLTFLLSTIAGVGVISWLIAEVHGAMHTPKDKWIERQFWFKWLDEHHYIHHVDVSANLNFLLPICDYVYGSRKVAMTTEESKKFPSYAQARKIESAGAGHEIAHA